MQAIYTIYYNNIVHPQEENNYLIVIYFKVLTLKLYFESNMHV